MAGSLCPDLLTDSRQLNMAFINGNPCPTICRGHTKSQRAAGYATDPICWRPLTCKDLSALLRSDLTESDTSSAVGAQVKQAAPPDVLLRKRGLPVYKTLKRCHYIHDSTLIIGMTAFLLRIVAITDEKLTVCGVCGENLSGKTGGRLSSGSGP